MDDKYPFTPINGGMNSETGGLVLLFQRGEDRLRLEIPYDQSGMLLESVERATKRASEHPLNEPPDQLGGRWDTYLQPREAKEVIIGADYDKGTPLIIVKIEGGFQFSFLLDRQILETIRSRSPRHEYKPPSTSKYQIVADDIDYFQNNWCTLYQPPSDIEIRWGVAAIRRLLIDGLLGQAWRENGLTGEPSVEAPNVLAILAQQGTEVRHVASLIAGGACIDGVESSVIGSARTHNESTGIGPDAEEGFAVSAFQIARDARGEETEGPLNHLVRSRYSISNWLNSVGAVRIGETIRRHDIIQFFAKVEGGVHLDRKSNRKGQEKLVFDRIRDLQGKVQAFKMEGLYFEIFSIGQALGKSSDLNKLKGIIRTQEVEQT